MGPVRSDKTIATLDFAMTYRFKIRGPLAPTDGSPQGARQYWEMTEGTLQGDRIHATIAMPGGDWYTAGNDGFGRPDVRVQFVTDDGAVVFLHYTGLVQQTAAFVAASTSGSETAWDDQYMRMAMTFHTASPKYAWLNESLFVAVCRLAGRNELEYMIYRVT